jgi:hypothetical protein
MSAPPIPPPKPIDVSQKEALVSLTAMLFVEEHQLLPKDKLADARNSLQALFLRTSGEETLLRKLIDILKTTQGIQRSFAQIRRILDGIRGSGMSVESKVTALRVQLEVEHVSPQEYTLFVGPFLSFSQTLSGKVGAFARTLDSYLYAKEEEARLTGIYRIARAARERLKQRLAGGLGAEAQSEVETRIKNEVVSTFDFSEAEANLKYARRDARTRELEVREQLADIRAMCQLAMNPNMRDKDEGLPKAAAEGYDDVFAMFSQTLRKHPGLLRIKDQVIELFKMYQHAYGMFKLDVDNLNRSLATMLENPEAYFQSKDEDRDIRGKRQKLELIEALIPFLERTAEVLPDEECDTFSKFSRLVSEMISRKAVPWEQISGELLRSKVQAEAELSTRL